MIEDIQRCTLADDQNYFENPIEKHAACYRHLADYQPFARPKTAKACALADEILPLHLDLMEPADHAFYALRYNYNKAEQLWSNIDAF